MIKGFVNEDLEPVIEVGLVAGEVERDTEVYKDTEGYFLKIPVELVESLDVHEKKRTRIWCVGKRIFLEIG